jgi:thioesterase domain-containing protein
MGVALMSSPTILLKPGADPAIFITHGLGGHLNELSKLIDDIKTEQKVYGVQWRGLNGSEPFVDFGEMADFFVDAIKKVQSEGPYLLAGLSVGGLAMLEVAMRLAQRGHKIGLLLLLDTYPPPRYWPLNCWIQTIVHRIRFHSAELVKMSLPKAIPYLCELSQNFLRHIRLRRGDAQQSKLFVDENDAPELTRLRESTFEAFLHYKPRYYPGKITFLKAEIATRYPSDPASMWKRFCSGIEIIVFSCSHAEMITTHTEEVGARLGQTVAAAVASSG